ncbi:MAG: oligosaccharide flippase family protein, partial [Ignavibacteriaceae bacterium]
MKLNKNLKNVISLFSIEFVARFFAFIAVTYLARIMGTSGFGVINIGLAVLSYAMIVANGGLTLLGTKKIAAGSANNEKLAGDIFLTRVLFSFILFVTAIVISYIFITSGEVFNVITAYLFFLFPSAVLLEWFFHGLQRMDVIA